MDSNISEFLNPYARDRLLGFLAHNEDTEEVVPIFAPDPDSAFKIACQNMDMREGLSISIGRVPHFDKYSDMCKIPVLHLVRTGLFSQCSNCGKTITPADLDGVGVDGQHIVCSPKCMEEAIGFDYSSQMLALRNYIKATEPDLYINYVFISLSLGAAICNVSIPESGSIDISVTERGDIMPYLEDSVSESCWSDYLHRHEKSLSCD